MFFFCASVMSARSLISVIELSRASAWGRASRPKLGIADSAPAPREWILDQYKEKKPKDPTIRDKFNSHRFADYKQKVIDLLRLTTSGVRTAMIVNSMKRTIR